MKKLSSLRTAFALLLIVGSLAALLYPLISNYLFENRADSLIETYDEEVESMGNGERTVMYEAAVEYNDSLAKGQVLLKEPFDENVSSGDIEPYASLLNPNKNGIMCCVDIPKINVYLPVYHGTGDAVLEKGIGHLVGSSLPVGGINTHCVLSGHTGLNHAKMFTDLASLEEGDMFYLHTLGEVLAYQTDQIKVVEPEDVSDLEIVSGEDYVTLVTCTPYGVNSHRLLVRGTRVPYNPEDYEGAQSGEQGIADSKWMQEYVWALFAGILVIVAVYIVSRIVRRRRPK